MEFIYLDSLNDLYENLAEKGIREGGDRAVLVFATTPLEDGSNMPNVVVDDSGALPMRIRTACEGSKEDVPIVRIELSPVGANNNGTFTVSDAQTYAVMMLDAICAAFDV